MRIGLFFSGSVMVLSPIASRAASCTAQAELGSLDRDALAAATGRLATAVLAQDFNALQANLLPQEASQWDGIRAAVEQAAPLVKGGNFQLRDVYLLDASEPDGDGRYAILLLQLDGLADCDHQYDGAPAGTICGGAGRCGGRAAGRPDGAGSGVGWRRNRSGSWLG